MSSKTFERLIKKNVVVQFLYIFLGSLFFKFLSLFVKTNKKMILFSSFGGKSFNDSPKAIFDEIVEKYGNSFVYVWAFLNPDNHSVPNDCTKVKINSLKYFVYALKSKYWVTNVNIERGLHFKKKKTVYLNTWHGLCLDYIGNDRKGRKDYNFKKMNYMCVSGLFDEKIYKTAFNLSDYQYLRCGMPRNDILVNKNIKVDEIKKKLNIPLDKKIILYAPTWRENKNNKESNFFHFPLDLKKWNESFGDKYLILFRSHSITTDVDGVIFNNFCFDVSKCPNTSDILLISDILITDYSSILFDYALLGRPIFNFGYDYDEYSKEHGFYVDYEKEMPNGIIKDEDELLNAIKNINYQEQSEKTLILKEKYIQFFDGTATKKCVESLFKGEINL